jgi:predicted O-methyltransferase YrrM
MGLGRRALSSGYRLSRRIAARFGVHLVRKRFTSPIPILDELPESIWSQRSTLSGVQFDPDEQLAFVETNLSRYLGEFQPPLAAPSRPDEYFVANGFFNGVDAQILYSMIRHLRPARVVELGSGYSSLVIAAALARNSAEGQQGAHLVVDPFPSAALSAQFWEQSELLEQKAEETPVEQLASSLSRADILFVDTSHAVRIGGDVTFIILDVLPALRDGVVVHFHDIFLPWHYPREWFEDHEWYWAEQYMLQAFLAFNAAYEVLVSVHLLARKHGDRLRDLAPLARHIKSEYECQSLWLRRR